MRLMQSTAIVGLALLTSCGGDGGSGGAIGVVPAPTPSPSPAPSPTPAPSPSPKPTGGPSTVVDFSFANDTAGWTAGFADYTPGQENSIGFNAAETQLPSPLGTQLGFALSGNNVSNDLFMYIWKPVTGLAPNTRYQVAFTITFATNAPPGCPGSPGENVWIEAGATNVQPANVIQNGRVTVNFDKGDQGTGGANAAVLGTFAQPTAGGDCNAPSWQSKTLASGSNGPFVTSDASGEVWLVIGTDSGFGGTTKIYYINGEATLSPTGS